MTWYLYLMLFLAVCLWPLSILVAVVIGGKLARGEDITMAAPEVPRAIMQSPLARKALWREQETASERAYADKIANLQVQGKT